MLQKFLISAFLFILSMFLIGQNLDKPFWGEHDWNGVRYGNIARNYLRYGLSDLKFAQVENSGSLENQSLIYYTHYPPLLPITISLSYKLFGVTEFATRLVPIIATSGSIALVFLIGSMLFGIRVGVVSSLIALLLPMTLYFGKNASHEPLTLFFILLSFYGYLLYRREVKYSLALFIAGLILAEATAWAGYFLVPAITLVAFLRKDFKQLKFILPFWLFSFLMFLIHIGIVYFATGNFSGGNLLGSLLQRGGLLSGVQPEGFSLPGYFDRIRLWFSTTFTLTLTIFSAAWLIIKIFGKFKDNDWYILILGFIGLIYLFVFSNAVYIHNYLIFYFLPYISLSATLMLFSVKSRYDRLVYHIHLKSLYFVFVIASILLIAFERREFLNALNNSQSDRFAVEIGKEIRRNSKPDDVVLIIPQNFFFPADNFLKFYSDRQLLYSDLPYDFPIYVLVDQQSRKFEIIKK